MTAEKLQEIYKRYSEGKVSKEQTQRELWDVLFKYKEQFIPTWVREDELQEFMVVAERLLFHMLESYNSRLSVFSTFFFGTVSISRQWCHKKSAVKRSRSVCCNALLEEGSVDVQSVEIPEDTICNKSWHYRGQKSWVCRAKSDKKRAIRRDICLVLAIKSCMQIDDLMIEKVAFETGVSTQDLQQMILQAKQSMEKKIERVEKLIIRRNFAYFRRKWVLIKKTESKGAFLSWFTDEKLNMYDRKWKMASDLIAKQRMTPSNDVVAGILLMSPKRVGFLLNKAKELLIPDGIANEDMTF